MRDRLANTPNYTCVLEIDRIRYGNRGGSTELARVEIGVVEGRELFSWPGESTTHESLEELLGPGLSSTGEFSAHGRSTFLDSRSSIERLPEERQMQSGRVGFSYRVPLEASRYAVAGDESRAMAPYEGELWLKADSGELVRFEVRVRRPPAESGIERIDSFVVYESRPVSGRPAWLPSEARIVVESSAGQTFRNDLRYLDCRAFRAESTIRFDKEALEERASAGPVRNVVVPEGLELAIEVGTAFDSEHARAGDPFEARLLQAASAGGEELLPEGAAIRGRVRRLALIAAGTGRQARRVATLTLELLEASWEGRCGRVSATLRAIDKIPKMAPIQADGLRPPRAFFNSERAMGYRNTPRMSAQGFGTFVILGERYEIPEGARMRWRTEAPPAGACGLR